EKNRSSAIGHWGCLRGGFYSRLFGNHFDRSGREVEPKRRAGHRLALDVDKAAVVFDDAIDHGKSQSGSLTLVFGGKEGLENPLPNALIYSDPGIAHFKTDVAASHGFAHVLQGRAVDGLSFEGQSPAVGHRVAGVYAEIQERLLDVILVGHDRRQV